jgi:hypothetical protein
VYYDQVVLKLGNAVLKRENSPSSRFLNKHQPPSIFQKLMSIHLFIEVLAHLLITWARICRSLPGRYLVLLQLALPFHTHSSPPQPLALCIALRWQPLTPLM